MNKKTIKTESTWVPIYELPSVTVLDLLPIVEYKEVKRSIDFFWRNQTKKNDFSLLFEQLKRFPKVKLNDKDEFIEVNICGFNELKKDRDARWYGILTNMSSLSFRRWRELVNIPISKDTLHHYRPEEIVALFIYEITWYGTEEDSQKIARDLDKKVKQIKKNYDRESKKRK